MNNTLLHFAILCLFLFSCTEKKSKPNYDLRSFFEGKEVYKYECAVCHGKEGEGKGRLYPPLNASDYLDQNIELLPCIIANGIEGKIIVNGKDYNVRMLGFEHLSDQEIHDVSNYVRNAWTNSFGELSNNNYNFKRNSCKK